jgi:hypothetical protein
MIREVLLLNLRAVAKTVPDHTAALLAAAERCVNAPDMTAAKEAALTGIWAAHMERATAREAAQVERTFLAETEWAAQEAARVAQTMCTAGAALTAEAEIAMYADDVAQVAADIGLRAARMIKESTIDDTLKTVVAAALQAYEQTA